MKSSFMSQIMFGCTQSIYTIGAFCFHLLFIPKFYVFIHVGINQYAKNHFSKTGYSEN
jgi:hypothetical protein